MLLGCRIVEGFDLQSQPRERGLQVMRHRREHPRPAVEVALQSVLHRVECACGVPQLPRALLFELRLTHIAPDTVGGASELRKRSRDASRRHEQGDRHDDN
jgi:hypothetical protein